MGMRGSYNTESVMGVKAPSERRHSKKRKVKFDDIEPTIPEELLPENQATGFVGDLFWVYEQLGGKEALLKMLKDDAKVKKEFLKQLLQHETRKLEKVNNNPNAKPKGRLLILRGLYDEKDGVDENAQAKQFANVLDPVSEKTDAYSEKEEFLYEAIEPEEVVIIEEGEDGSIPDSEDL